MASSSTAIGLRSVAARFEANTPPDPFWGKGLVLFLSLGFFCSFSDAAHALFVEPAPRAERPTRCSRRTRCGLIHKSHALTAAIAVPLNLVFGGRGAGAITKLTRCKRCSSPHDLPFSVSPLSRVYLRAGVRRQGGSAHG